MITSTQVREELDRAIVARKVSYAALSRALGRNGAYIQQFIKLGRPTRLAEEDRRFIAAFLGVDEALLGAPERDHSDVADIVKVRRLTVEASAGVGAAVEGEVDLPALACDRGWLRRLTAARPDQVSTIRVRGDSMAPALLDGDEAIVDCTAKDPRRGDYVFVLRRDDSLLVKRVTISPTSGLLTVSSDNPAYPSWHDCSPDSIDIIGRVVGIMRTFS